MSCFYVNDVNNYTIPGGHIANYCHFNGVPVGSHVGYQSFLIQHIMNYIPSALSTKLHASIIISTIHVRFAAILEMADLLIMFLLVSTLVTNNF